MKPLLLLVSCSIMIPEGSPSQQPRVATVELMAPPNQTGLSGVSWLGIEPSGGIVVRHSGPEPLRRFDSRGNALRSVAIEKAAEIAGIGWVSDRLWVWQRGAQAAELFDFAGKSAGSMAVPTTLLLPTGEQGPFASGVVAPVPLGLTPSGGAVFQALVLGNRPVPAEWQQPTGVRVGIFRARSDGVVQYLVAWAAPSSECALRVPGAQALAPFCNRARTLVSGDGSRTASVAAILSGPDSGTVRVLVQVESGDTVYERKYVATLRAVTTADADSAAESLVQAVGPTGSTELIRAIRAYRPVFYPPASSALFAADGSLWIGSHPTGASREWTVLSADGTTLTRALLPSDLTLWAVRGTTAWATRLAKNGGASLIKLRL